MGAKARKSHGLERVKQIQRIELFEPLCWEGGQVGGPESGDPGYPEYNEPLRGKRRNNDTKYELKISST
jgi:hypothetical protein